jgi:hypothetical protein
MKENVATKTHILSARQQQPKAAEFANSKGDCKIVFPPMFPPSLEKVSQLQSGDPGLQLEGAHVVKGPSAHVRCTCERLPASETTKVRAGIRNCSKYIRVSKFAILH